MQCNLWFDEFYVHDDHYVIVVHDVLVFSVTSNRQLICQFHELLVTDNAMMDITFPCASLHLRLLCCIKETLLLLFARDEIELRTPTCYCCVALSHPRPDSCAHGNRESRPPKPVSFVSSSARVKIGNQVFGERLPCDCSFVLLPPTTSQ